ncbi:MAG: DUF4202 family protein, partial [Acidimicrobiales bacterium]|nr:DUF4202 family protein [Acidimicrobiales bacterium]
MTAAGLDAVFSAIDAANAADPNQHEGQPLALLQGQLASAWLNRLTAAASAEVQVAVRAHHLERWKLARSDYPEGRGGYLRWRSANKAHQANAAAAILTDHG